MPVVPPSGTSMDAEGKSPLASKPTETDLLMSAADMHGMGRLVEEPQRSMPEGQERPRVSLKRKGNRPLKVVK